MIKTVAANTPAARAQAPWQALGKALGIEALEMAAAGSVDP
jgi:hypothetical protein